MHVEERLRREISGFVATSLGADEQVVDDRWQPAQRAGQHDQERDASSANVLSKKREETKFEQTAQITRIKVQSPK